MPHALLLRAARAMDAATTPEEVVEKLSASVLPTKVRLLGMWPGDPLDDVAFMLGRTLYDRSIPSEFRERFAELSAIHGRSQLAYMAARAPMPFTFSEAMARLQPQGDDRWVFDVLREYGMRDGFYCGYGSWFVCYWSPVVLKKAARLGMDMRRALYAAGALAVHRLQELRLATIKSEDVLAASETTVLARLSSGESAAKIAAQLGITEGALRSYVKRAIKKLGARNQRHALTLAIRRRMI